ncbi:MAG: DnaT-like ssDNA-binding protein [Pseudomonadota bacterium]
MALIVETGAGMANAESYASVSEANAYHRAGGNEAKWIDLDVDVKEIHLRNATKFMRRVYRARWAGGRVRAEQALDWPRYGVRVDDFAVLSTIVPTDVKDACIELALRAIDGPLLPDMETGSNQIKRDKVGPLETEYFQVDVDARARFTEIDALLAPYFGSAGGSNSIKLVRA